MAVRAAGAILTMVLLAAPAAAQPADSSTTALTNRWPIPVEEKLPLGRKGVSLPVIEYATPDGGLKVRRGIVASVEVAPNTLVGVGLFETRPKKDGYTPDDPLGMKPKPSRKAAVGISFSF